MNRTASDTRVFRSLLAGLTLVLGLHAAPAGAACTAANPNPFVVETTPTADFTVHGDDTVTHTKTGLMWKKCIEGYPDPVSCRGGGGTDMNWATALTTAADSTFAGYHDWRLPNLKELLSIAELCGKNPAINQTIFPVTPVMRFWSASTWILRPREAWFVDFDPGQDGASSKSDAYYVRLVRGGQLFDSFNLQSPVISLLPETFFGSDVLDGYGSAVANGGSTLSSLITLTFGGTAAVGVAGFQCKLDAAAFSPCASPKTYSGLKIGSHTFQVRAFDAAGNADSSPAIFTWTVLTPAQATTFASFTTKLEVKLGPSVNDDEFEIKANFSLGTGSDGISPLTEDVTLQIGGFSITVPAGSFKYKPPKNNKPAEYKFEGTINGVKLEAKIKPAGNGFEFKAEGKGANLAGIAIPETVKLTIGNDSGSTTAIPEFK